MIQNDFFFSGIFVTLSRLLFPICTEKQKHRTMSSQCVQGKALFFDARQESTQNFSPVYKIELEDLNSDTPQTMQKTR